MPGPHEAELRLLTLESGRRPSANARIMIPPASHRTGRKNCGAGKRHHGGHGGGEEKKKRTWPRRVSSAACQNCGARWLNWYVRPGAQIGANRRPEAAIGATSTSAKAAAPEHAQ